MDKSRVSTPTTGALNLATLVTTVLTRSEPQNQQDEVGTTKVDRYTTGGVLKTQFRMRKVTSKKGRTYSVPDPRLFRSLELDVCGGVKFNLERNVKSPYCIDIEIS